MANLQGFDATQYEPTTSYDPIPSGKYNAAITASDLKATKAGTGSYLELELTVLDGEYQGRKVWSRLNINNPSQQATEIGRRELSAVCHAVGVMQPNDSAELHNLPMVISVKNAKRNDTGEMVNEVKSFEASQTSTAITQPGPQAPANADVAPWKR